MKNKSLKKKKEYLILGGLILGILAIIYIIKDFFPFGDNFLMWGDMHAQIAPFYYKFYDAIYNGGSLLVDFNSGAGMPFLGIFNYYISSPFTLLVLLFPRSMIPHATTLIISLKILTCGLTALYFFRKHTKNLPSNMKILLSLLYAFCTYNLAHYIITGWIDIVYMFPLLLSSLIDLLNNKEKSTIKYIILLAISLIFNFYTTIMVLIFIVLCTFIYMRCYKKDLTKEILHLGISTLLGLLISAIALVPTFLQIKSSIRGTFDIEKILLSKTGPLIDKITYLFTSGTVLGISLYGMLKNKKEPFTKCFFIISFLLLVPILIEPINKMWHFGSYSFYPYRYGFIPTFVFLLAGAYYFDKLKLQESTTTKNIISILLTAISIIIYVLVSIYFYADIQASIDSLSFTANKLIFLALFAIFFISIAATFILTVISSKKTYQICIWFLSLTIILANSFLYLGIDSTQNTLKEPYKIMQELKVDLPNDDFRVKQDKTTLDPNFGMILSHDTLDQWTSLTDNDSFIANQRLGYNSYWMDTQSGGANLFIDLVFGNKYLLSKEESPFYTKVKKYNSLTLSESNYDLREAYLINDSIAVSKAENSFAVSNAFAKTLFREQVFDIKNLPTDSEVIEEKIKIEGKQEAYLEIYTSYLSTEKQHVLKSFDVYVNDKLLYEDFYNKDYNNVLDLGLYENEEISIKIVRKKDVTANYIAVGLLDLTKVDNCFAKEKEVLDLSYKQNKINVEVNNVRESKYLFIPANLLNGMQAKCNNKKTELVKIADQYIGIPLEKGENKITITYHSPGLKLGIILSIIGIVLTVLYEKLKVVLEKTWLPKLAKALFILAASAIFIVVYIIPFIGFIYSWL